MSLNSPGNTTAPVQSRADCPEALAKIREMNKEAIEAGYNIDPIIEPDRQI